MKQTKTTNPELIQLIRFLKKQGREKEAAIWRDVAEQLAKTRQQRAVVNLSRLNRPGKLLAAGALDHSVTVAAFTASEKAKEKLKAAKAKYLSITELMEKNPNGTNIKIIR